MKRNLVPLIAIAFVVAAISTGVFYGLFAGRLHANAELPRQALVVAAKDLQPGTVLKTTDVRVSEIHGGEPLKGYFDSPEKLAGATLSSAVMMGEPITASHVGVKNSRGESAPSTVPTGMRAVSVHVYESDALAPLLHPGSRVDLQAYLVSNNLFQFHTILQNIEVLGVTTQPENSRNPGIYVTVLTRPLDADLLAVADSAARLRVALRNPSDSDAGPRRVLPVSALFTRPVTPLPPGKSLELAVSVLGVAQSGSDDSIQVRNLAPADLSALHGEVVQSGRLTIAPGHAAVFNAGDGSCRLRLKVASETSGSLRLTPEVLWTRNSGLEKRGFERDIALADGSDVVVSGLLDGKRDGASLEQLFPGRNWNSREMVILLSRRPDGSR
ncbi:MAG TPA: Flp pilus assembly protein CpaB [Bryobacteraceae bacterium]|nr:Flp pilus assembly protein CpaB [Bryobacteraceae bacterium]